MPTFDDGENLGSVRTKINAAITTVDNLEAQGGNLYAAYETRAEAVTAVAGGLSVPNGGIMAAGGLFYVADDTATAISDLPGWLPQGDITPNHFGALGDGMTDDSPSVSAWITYLIANNESGYAPSGTYLMNSFVDLSDSGSIWSIRGAGKSTVFKTPATNTSGAIRVTSAARSGQLILENFKVATEADGGGIGLAYTQPEGGNQHQRALVCSNVTVEGVNKTTNRFDTFADFSGTWRPFLENVTISGPFVGVDFTDGSPQYAAELGINMDSCYDPTVTNCHVWGAYTGIRSHVYTGQITGVSDQGGGVVRITVSNGPHPFTTGFNATIQGTASYDGTYSVTNISDTEFDITAAFVASETGTVNMSAGPEAFNLQSTILGSSRIAFDYQRPQGREPIIWATDCHANWRDNGLKIDGAKLVIVKGFQSYNQDSGNEYSGTAVDLNFENVSEYIVSGNIFHFDGATDRINIFVESDTAGEGDNGLITDNVFNSVADYCVWLSSGVSGVAVKDNIYSGTIGTSEINDVSGNNVISDLSVEQSGTWTPSLTFGGASTGIAYTLQSGDYRIHNGTLTYRIELRLSSKGTSTGNAEISLPTTLQGTQSPTANSGNGDFVFYSGMSGLSSPTVRPLGATSLRLINQGAAVIANLSDANFTNSSIFVVTGTILLS